MGSPGFLETLVLTNLSTIFSKCIAAPIEIVKLLLQNQGELVRGGQLAAPLTGVINCASSVILQDGFFALWRGNLTQLFQPSITTVLNGTISPILRRLSFDRNRNYFLWFTSNVATGALAGSITMAFTFQLEYIRTQLACDVSHRFTGAIDVIQQTIAADGFFSIYRSFWISVLGVVTYRAVYFGLYDSLRPLVRRDNFLLSFLLGWTVTVASGLLTYPCDTIRRRMMVSLCGPLPYHGAWECASEIVAKEGTSTLWAGALTNSCRGVIGALALTFTDKVQERYLEWRFPKPPPPPPQYEYEEQQTQ
jgi:solute carrier family 25 (mitochondrial adenine nucleotide translocator), member 4/5/6/31